MKYNVHYIDYDISVAKNLRIDGEEKLALVCSDSAVVDFFYQFCVLVYQPRLS